jgi:predicted DNA-binding transcriptional regulator YafY
MLPPHERRARRIADGGERSGGSRRGTDFVVPRNQEVIRQWRALHLLESSRHGVAIDALANELGVTTRTIRRDLAALQEAGFPLYDERDDDGRVRWRIDGQVLKGLEAGFTLAELCALYLSRNLLESVAGTPFQRDLGNAFARLEKMLSPRMRQFLDRLPSVLVAKPGPRARGGAASATTIAQLLEATLHFRVARMRYHSVSSARVKDYLVHPYRLAFAEGGMYLLAYVPEYDAVRTFAIDRIASVSLEKQTFTPNTRVPEDIFGNSLGVNTGPAEPVEIVFESRVAPYVKARVWHPSQQVRDEDDGRVTLSMQVCHDWALRSWLLSWGPFAHVRSPRSLADAVRADLQSASAQYEAGASAPRECLRD